MYSADYESNVVNYNYEGYSAEILPTSTSSLLATSTSGLELHPESTNITNSESRIEIDAHNLNLKNASIRAESYARIHADEQLVDQQLQAALDVPVVDYDLSTTNPVFYLSNVVSTSVSRLAGDIFCYSAYWTNIIDTLDNGGNVIATNRAIFSVLIVDPYFSSPQPATLSSFRIHATNIVLEDNLTVTRSLLLDSDTLQVANNGLGVAGLSLPGNWDSTIFPRLKSLTNEGNLLIARLGHVPDGLHHRYEFVHFALRKPDQFGDHFRHSKLDIGEQFCEFRHLQRKRWLHCSDC